MKRSKRVVLTTLTAASVAAVQACGGADWNEEPSVEAFPFASLAECEASATVPASECAAAQREALANHEQAAPRFDSQRQCEEDFGGGQCQQRAGGTGGYWMPLLAGFMIGRAIDGGRPYYRRGGLYRGRGNEWYTGGAAGRRLHRSGSGWRAGASGFGRPIASPSIRSRSMTASRGGFGSRSRGGFGG